MRKGVGQESSGHLRLLSGCKAEKIQLLLSLYIYIHTHTHTRTHNRNIQLVNKLVPLLRARKFDPCPLMKG